MTSLVKTVRNTVAGVTVVALTSPLAFAQGVPINPNATSVLGSVSARFKDVPTLITTLFQLVITAAGTIFVLMFLFGGIQYLTSAGNEEGSTKARKLLVDAVVGLIIVLAAYAIGTYILAQVGIGADNSVTFQ
jgi:cytochrome bd-type quinol oxidase subunit 2